MSKQRDTKGRFLTGNNGGGRPKGSRSRLGERFLADHLADWEDNGIEAIQRMRESKPAEYVRAVASVLPKELHVGANDLSDLSDGEIAKRLAIVMRQLVSLEDSFGEGADQSGEILH